MQSVQIGFEFEFVRTCDEWGLNRSLKKAGLRDGVLIDRDESVTNEYDGDSCDCECDCEEDYTCSYCEWGCDCCNYDDAGGFEVITDGPLPYAQSIVFLKKFLRWMVDTGEYADDTCGLHVNISFIDNKHNQALNPVKLLRLYNEQRIGELFGREDNRCYANQWRNRINFDKVCDQGLWETMRDEGYLFDKFHSINFGNWYSYTKFDNQTFDQMALQYNPRLEFRSPGGCHYEKKYNELRDSIAHMVYCMREATKPVPVKLEFVA